MKFRELEKILIKYDWYFVAKKGSHNHYKHSTKTGKVTVPNHGGKDLHPDTMQSIKKHAGLL